MSVQDTYEKGRTDKRHAWICVPASGTLKHAKWIYFYVVVYERNSQLDLLLWIVGYVKNEEEEEEEEEEAQKQI